MALGSSVGAFVDGLFSGAKTMNELLKSRNDLYIQNTQIAAGEDYMRQKAESDADQPNLTRTPGTGAEGSGTSQPPAETPATMTPSRGYAAPPPDQADLIQKAAEKYNLDPAQLTGLIGVESNFRPNAVGPNTPYGTAKGLGQFLDSTAKELGITNVFDPEQAIFGAAKYLRQGLDAYGGDINKALMYYHGGPTESKWGDKTRAYPGAVLSRAQQFAQGSPNRIALPEVGAPDAPPTSALGQDYIPSVGPSRQLTAPTMQAPPPRAIAPVASAATAPPTLAPTVTPSALQPGAI